ncbi:3-hydroxy-3-methylglutaryl-coenzyme A reductase [Desulfuromonas soudanensis]|uniref:hydroxymethylglutaryl-CoA reductase (NADPH) n=1 Tax=Desulfuromonas soudanensis TaxID=1603606 RepID=A0A0M5ILP5_9BACT|nr:hydroxymethylglutaryl-CoA reductase [Desulfuromonas soudanensis]ALC18018.1 3-hydroxy-3-methylglutaryl-coenzyme A reductase [Desulfuromonas soudanensis]
MPRDAIQTQGFLAHLLQNQSKGELLKRLEPNWEPPAAKVPGGARITPEIVARRWKRLALAPEIRAALLGDLDPATLASFGRNIENFIGVARLPIGLAGPLRVNGLFAQGDYLLPLATTEAALVASYHRGASLLSQAGGCSSMLLAEGVSRAPGFAFQTAREAGLFVAWAMESLERIRGAADATSRYARLKDLRITIEGNHVYLLLEFQTGDASGQNMATIATEAVCALVAAESPVTPEYFFVEANMSGDKKASAQSFLGVRGKKVTAEAIIPAELVEKILHTTPLRMTDYWRMSALGGVLSGTIGVQGHYANGLAALYIACGQDAACIAESAVGVTRFEVREDGALYAAVTLPNLMVGTIGGGTGLPTQHACLELMGLAGAGKARALAEVCAGMVLAGELSIIGALAAGEFTSAHKKLARGKEQSKEGDNHD